MDSQERLLRLPEVMYLTGLCKSDVYRLEAAGLFPKRRRLGGKTVCWTLSDILRFVESRPTVAENQR